MKLYRTTNGIFVEQQQRWHRVPAAGWDELICSADLVERVRSAAAGDEVGEVEAVLCSLQLLGRRCGPRA